MTGMHSIVVDMADELQLVVVVTDADPHGNSASIWQGRYPRAKRISITVFDTGEARVDVHAGEVILWLGRTRFELPWLQLLKVADFLRLPIAVPATELVEVES